MMVLYPDSPPFVTLGRIRVKKREEDSATQFCADLFCKNREQDGKGKSEHGLPSAPVSIGMKANAGPVFKFSIVFNYGTCHWSLRHEY